MKKRSGFNKRKAVFIGVFCVFAVYALTLVYPFLWLALNSFRDKRDFYFYPLRFPEGVLLKNYETVFGRFNLPAMFSNSIILSVGGTLGSIFASALAAYTVSKFEFRGRNLIYAVAITVMLIPTTGALAPLYRFMNDTKLAGRHAGIILMYSGGFGFNFFLLYGYFKSVSWFYAEAAMIDGASDFKVFYKIMLPHVRPALFAVGIISFIGFWNDYFTPYLFLSRHPTLAVGIQRLADDITIGANASDYPALFAAMLISTLPIVVLFSVFQKTIIDNTVAGGMKG